MKNHIQQLDPNDITSEIYVISPTQIEYIAQIFGDSVADAMNMRAFAGKLRTVARASLRKRLAAAKKQGAK